MSPTDPQPWTCPRCTRVWGPGVSACKPCNDAVDRERRQHPSSTPYTPSHEPQIIPLTPSTPTVPPPGWRGPWCTIH